MRRAVRDILRVLSEAAARKERGSIEDDGSREVGHTDSCPALSQIKKAIDSRRSYTRPTLSVHVIPAVSLSIYRGGPGILLYHTSLHTSSLLSKRKSTNMFQWGMVEGPDVLVAAWHGSYNSDDCTAVLLLNKDQS